MYFKLTPTGFGKLLPSSGGRRCLISYSSNVYVVGVYGDYDPSSVATWTNHNPSMFTLVVKIANFPMFIMVTFVTMATMFIMVTSAILLLLLRTSTTSLTLCRHFTPHLISAIILSCSRKFLVICLLDMLASVTGGSYPHVLSFNAQRTFKNRW
jgi:hypothetical protein